MDGRTVQQQTSAGAAGAAMAVRATADGFRRRRLRRWALVAGSWALVAATVTGAGVLPEDPDPYVGLQVMPLLVLLMIAPAQLIAVACGRRERRILESYGWRAYPCEVRIMKWRVEVRTRLESDEVVVLTPRMVRHVPGLSGSKQPDQAWFCGDPRYGGVLSPVGGGWPVRHVRDERPKKRRKRPEPFPGADELAERSGVLGTVY